MAETRAIRGATTVAADEAALVRAATEELLATILERNELVVDDVISAFFTVTPDLVSEFPALAARQMGWDDVPLLCALEIPVVGAMGRCIRVLLHVTTDRPRHAVEHVYLHGAAALRPDLVARAVAPAGAAGGPA